MESVTINFSSLKGEIIKMESKMGEKISELVQRLKEHLNPQPNQLSIVFRSTEVDINMSLKDLRIRNNEFMYYFPFFHTEMKIIPINQKLLNLSKDIHQLLKNGGEIMYETRMKDDNDSNSAHEAMCLRLMEMGFSRSESISALLKTNYKLGPAADVLIENRARKGSSSHFQKVVYPSVTRSQRIIRSSSSGTFARKPDSRNENRIPEIILSKTSDQDIKIVKEILKPGMDLNVALQVYIECNKNIEQTKICLANMY